MYSGGPSPETVYETSMASMEPLQSGMRYLGDIGAPPTSQFSCSTSVMTTSNRSPALPQARTNLSVSSRTRSHFWSEVRSGNISTRMMGTGFLPGGTNGIGGRVPASGSERHLLQVWEHFDGEAFHSFEVLALGLAQVGAQDDLVEAGLRVFG